jgi:uncharacterized protein (DUF305 family)
MKRSTLKTLAVPAAVLLAMSVGTAASAHEQKKPDQADKAAHSSQMGRENHSMAGHSEGSKELHRIMMQGQKMPMPMSGDVDKDFATMMTMHHEQAIKMSDVLLQHGDDAELKELARKMQASQREEIQKMAPHTK